jgi:transposase-like protein
MGKKKPQDQALLRAQLIMRVRCGLMTAVEAARKLGVSRKTYYKWEQRGLSALLDGLSDQQPGRPEKEEPPAQAIFDKQMAELRRENELLEQKLALKDLAFDLRIRSPKDRKKKK